MHREEKRGRKVSDNIKDASLREELGLTEERYRELLKITQSVIDKYTDNTGYGRTSHVLLSIAGRKDLTVVEKATCVFTFGSLLKNDIPDTHDCGMEITDMNILGDYGNIAGIMIAPCEADLSELIFVVMATLTSLVEQMPKREAQEFCRNASMAFARMASTDGKT